MKCRDVPVGVFCLSPHLMHGPFMDADVLHAIPDLSFGLHSDDRRAPCCTLDGGWGLRDIVVIASGCQPAAGLPLAPPSASAAVLAGHANHDSWSLLLPCCGLLTMHYKNTLTTVLSLCVIA